MKVLVVGASGTIGQEIVHALAGHEVVRASRAGLDARVDITDSGSIQSLYQRVGTVDAVICAAGGGAWKPLLELTEEDFEASLHNKLMGQVNLVRLGIGKVRESFTLTSGVLSQAPMVGSAAISLVNAGLEGFVRAAALELSPVRVNVVSPPWVAETLELMGEDRSQGMAAADVARSYVAAVTETQRTGAVIQSIDYR